MGRKSKQKTRYKKGGGAMKTYMKDIRNSFKKGWVNESLPTYEPLLKCGFCKTEKLLKSLINKDNNNYNNNYNNTSDELSISWISWRGHRYFKCNICNTLVGIIGTGGGRTEAVSEMFTM